jgi:hypothetical protein
MPRLQCRRVDWLRDLDAAVQTCSDNQQRLSPKARYGGEGVTLGDAQELERRGELADALAACDSAIGALDGDRVEQGEAMLLTANVLGRLGGPPEEMAALDATFEFVEGESALVFREMACEALFRKTACKTKVGNQIRWPSWNRLSHALEIPPS